MEKINCNVIQDLLPLYIDHAVCEDTKKVVEEHLRECESCRKAYQEIKNDLCQPVEIEKSDVRELRQFKKFLSKRQLRTIFVTVAGVLVFLVVVIVFMNRYMRYIGYQEAGLTFISEDADEVRFKDSIKGNYRWRNELDRDTGIMTVHYVQTLWDRFVDYHFYAFDHIHTFLKKDTVKVVYIDLDGTEEIVWEASKEEKESYFRQDRGALG